MRRVGLLVAFMLLGCAHSPSQPSEVPHASGFLSKHAVTHPLVGRFWDVKSAAFIDEAAVMERAARAHFVLVGEKHDNPDHHRMQVRVLRGMVESGRRPAVVFEMFTTAEQPAIDEAIRTSPSDADELARRTQWEKSGWPPWELYAPLAKFALEHRLPIVAGNLPRGTVRGLIRQGQGGMPSEQVERLGLRHPLPAGEAQRLRAELVASHCGMLKDTSPLVDNMALAQRARDASLAAELVERGRKDGAVLIAGNGHVRRDRGVPFALSTLSSTESTLSLANLEVADGVVDPRAYATGLHAEAMPFDVVYFTPIVTREDPCNKYKKRQ